MRNKVKMSLVHYKHFLLGACTLGIFIDIFLFTPTADLVILFLTGLWVLTVWLYKFEGRVSIAGALVFLAMCPFLLIFKKELIAEKAAIWTYMFLVIGVAQEFIEYLGENRKKQR